LKPLWMLLYGIVFKVSLIHIIHFLKSGYFVGILLSNQKFNTICTDYLEAKVERYCKTYQ
jgi:hypothetical protein